MAASEQGKGPTAQDVRAEDWSDDVLDRIQRELAGAETPLYLVADDILRVLEAAEAVPLSERDETLERYDRAREALGDLASLCPPHIMERYRDVRRERRARQANASRPEGAPIPAPTAQSRGTE